VRIGELSARSGVSARSLRYYEQHGLIEATRAPNGYREYDDLMVVRAAMIHALFGMGISRDVVTAVLGCAGPDAAQVQHDELASRLPGVLEELDARIGTMSDTRNAIADFLAVSAAPERSRPSPAR
jgi:DNA-binding transcriptional MerR regulator